RHRGRNGFDCRGPCRGRDHRLRREPGVRLHLHGIQHAGHVRAADRGAVPQASRPLWQEVRMSTPHLQVAKHASATSRPAEPEVRAATRHVKRAAVVFALLVAVAGPLFVESTLIQHFLVLIGINVILVLSLDLVVGMLGLSALGHAGFMGIGAYTSALLVMNQGFSFLGGLAAGTAMATFFGVLIGYPSLRLGGHFFVVVTFIVGIVFNLLFTNLVEITKGPMGLPGIPAPEIGGYVFQDKLSYY